MLCQLSTEHFKSAGQRQKHCSRQLVSSACTPLLLRVQLSSNQDSYSCLCSTPLSINVGIGSQARRSHMAGVTLRQQQQSQTLAKALASMTASSSQQTYWSLMRKSPSPEMVNPAQALLLQQLARCSVASLRGRSATSASSRR